MNHFSNTQHQIAEHLSSDDTFKVSRWTDWKWQLKNSITSVEMVEKLLNIQLAPLEREKGPTDP